MLMVEFLENSCWSLPHCPTTLAVCYVCYSCDHGESDSLNLISIFPLPFTNIISKTNAKV